MTKFIKKYKGFFYPLGVVLVCGLAAGTWRGAVWAHDYRYVTHKYFDEKTWGVKVEQYESLQELHNSMPDEVTPYQDILMDRHERAVRRRAVELRR